METMTIQTFYKDILKALGYVVESDDLVSIRMESTGTKIPAEVGGKRLVLPTEKRLIDGFDSDIQPFHPLSESVSRKKASPVLSHMRRTMIVRISDYIPLIASALCELAIDVEMQKNLPTGVGPFLKRVSKANASTADTLATFLNKAVNKSQLVIVYLKNGPKIGDDVYNRGCIVHFPFMRELEEKENPYDMKMSKKDRECLIAIFQTILPLGGDPSTYSEGSNSKVAPYLDSLLTAFYGVAQQINAVIKKFGKASNMPVKPIDLSFSEGHAVMATFYGKIPPLRGNDGDVDEEQSRSNQQHVETQHQRTQQPATKAKVESDKISVSDFLNGSGAGQGSSQQYQQNPQPAQQPMYNQNAMMMPNNGMNPMMYNQNPMMQTNGNMNMNPQPVMLPNGMVQLPNGMIVHPSQYQQVMGGNMGMAPQRSGSLQLPWNQGGAQGYNAGPVDQWGTFSATGLNMGGGNQGYPMGNFNL